jgi:uncharacterized membrane protein
MNRISETENRTLMMKALGSLSGKWGLAVGAWAIYMVVTAAINAIPGPGKILSLVISGPFLLGMTIFSLSLSRNHEVRIEHIFEGFKKFSTALGAYLLMVLFIVLWSLLLIVPGIVAAMAYSQVFFLIAEDGSIGPLEAIKKSKEIMNGNKWKYCCLWSRFTGWFILSILTAGIGFLWLAPYMAVAMAKFYDDIGISQATARP